MIVWEHGKYLGQTDVAHGTWSWELGRSWSKGEHPVKVYGVDASGFQSQRTEARFTAVEPGQGVSAGAPAAPLAAMISTVGPSTSAPVVLEPVAHEQVLDPRVVFTGSAAASTQVGFRENGVLLGGTVVAPNGAWSWESGWQWAAGRHVIDVFSVDASGTESPVTTVPFTVMHTTSGAAPAAYYGGTY